MNRKKIGVFLPWVGMPHQEYAWQFYQGLAPLPRRLICFDTVKDVRWDGFREDPIKLYPRSIIGRGLQKIYKTVLPCLSIRDRKLFSIVGLAPLGWKRYLRKAISENDIEVVVVIHGSPALLLYPFFKENDVKLVVYFGGSDFQMSDQYAKYKNKLLETARRADHCVFASNFLMQQARSRGCPGGSWVRPSGR